MKLYDLTDDTIMISQYRDITLFTTTITSKKVVYTHTNEIGFNRLSLYRDSMDIPFSEMLKEQSSINYENRGYWRILFIKKKW